MNKEISDALHMLLHCALKDKEYETQKEQFDIVYKHIEELHNKIDKLLKENESLRARIKIIKRFRKKQTQKKNKYKSIVIDFQKALEKKNNKIDKAIELAKRQLLSNSNYTGYTDEMCLKDLLEILKDSDVDE